LTKGRMRCDGFRESGTAARVNRCSPASGFRGTRYPARTGDVRRGRSPHGPPSVCRVGAGRQGARTVRAILIPGPRNTEPLLPVEAVSRRIDVDPFHGSNGVGLQAGGIHHPGCADRRAFTPFIGPLMAVSVAAERSSPVTTHLVWITAPSRAARCARNSPSSPVRADDAR